MHYSTEFKQYGIEAFVAFLLVYIYITGKDFRIFTFFIVIFILFSNTIIFIAFGLGCGYLYRNIFDLKRFFYKNLFYLLIIPIVFGIYYYGYIRYQAVSGFYDYWQSFFLPHRLAEYPKFFSEILLGTFVGYTPFGKERVLPVYMFISLLGFIWFYKNRKDMFIVTFVILLTAIVLSLLRIYPFGHNGIIGGRLSLYLSVIFYLLCASGIGYLISLSKNIWWRNCWSFVVICLVIADLCRYVQHLYKHEYAIQQTHELILKANTEFQSNDCVMIYKSTEPAFKYYSFLDNISLPYKVFDENPHFDSYSSCNHIFVLVAHASTEFVSKLDSLAVIANRNVKIIKPRYYGHGAFLLILSSKEKSEK
ncbi:hypothetical protein CQA66_05890 [Helicobacter aurati]|uniref:Glycosyltransferase RgtA/B/C/D-like domain-containing protein n=1 Tax=Helicobacter aurati TaxID=137778 RepID=A0A3D8J453_9HELI|nr:hypothetical protein [Helicobacter aurati]RDU71634.1 hypothetical protein CQA66_05890 [Helicobacter aurati]